MHGHKRIRVIEVPYHIGFMDEGMAKGPGKILGAGLLGRLREAGNKVSHTQAIRQSYVRDNNEAILEVNKVVQKQVTIALEQNAFPLVLSGGCSASLGVITALNTPTTGILWFDAHGDYNTPETTPSGYFGGMPLAVANGLGHADHWQGLTTQAVVKSSNTILIGIRDLDPGETDNLRNSGATSITGNMFTDHTAPHQLRDALVKLADTVEKVYLHLDIDVLDPAIAPGVSYPSPAGLTIDQLTHTLAMIGETIPVEAASLTAFNPAKDIEGQTLAYASKLAQTIVDTLIWSI